MKEQDAKKIFEEQGFYDLLEALDIETLDRTDDWGYIIFVEQGKADTPQIQKLHELMNSWNETVTVSELKFLTSDGNFRGPRVEYYLDVNEGWLVTLSDVEPHIEDSTSLEEALIKQLGWRHPARVVSVLKSLASEAKQGEHIEVGEMVIDPKDDYLLIFDIEDEFAGIVKVVQELQSRGHQTRDSHTLYYQVEDDGGDARIVAKYVSYWQGSRDYTASFVSEDAEEEDNEC